MNGKTKFHPHLCVFKLLRNNFRPPPLPSRDPPPPRPRRGGWCLELNCGIPRASEGRWCACSKGFLGFYGLFGWVHLGMVRCLTSNTCHSADAMRAQCNSPRILLGRSRGNEGVWVGEGGAGTLTAITGACIVQVPPELRSCPHGMRGVTAPRTTAQCSAGPCCSSPRWLCRSVPHMPTLRCGRHPPRAHLHHGQGLLRHQHQRHQRGPHRDGAVRGHCPKDCGELPKDCHWGDGVCVRARCVPVCVRARWLNVV